MSGLVTKRAAELAKELLDLEKKLPAPVQPEAQGSGAGGKAMKAWFKAQYSAHPQVMIAGGVTLAVALIGVIGFAIYRKKKQSESEN